MVKTVRFCLRETFSNLGVNNRKRFKSQLCDREGEPRVRRSETEKIKDSWSLTGLMVERFTSANAAAVTLEVLVAIGCNQQAENLRKAAGLTGTHDVNSNPSRWWMNFNPSDYNQKPDLIPCSREFKDKILKQKGEDVYKPLDKSARKRLALLINNIEFDDKSMNRSGAEKDEENMIWLLEKLDYKVEKHTNLAGDEINEAIKDFAQRQEHANSDGTFVVIMSHGKRGEILGVHYGATNNDVFPIDNIYTHLNNQNCPALMNKPKVILIQACRGDQPGRIWVSDAKREEPMDIERDGYEHKEKDFTCLRSCTPNTESYRHVERGTLYVRFLVHVFCHCAHEDDIDELFRKVMRLCEEKRGMGDNIQMVCKERVSMAKKFYLFPGL